MINLQNNSLTNMQALKTPIGYLLNIKDYNDYTVNGVMVKGVGLHQVESVDDVCLVKKGYQYVSHYTLEGVVVDKNTVDTLRNEVSAKYEKYSEDDVDYIYPDIDTEFEHKKALLDLDKYQSVSARTDDEYIKQDVEVVGEIVIPESKFIAPSLMVGKAKFTNGFYTLNTARVAMDEAIKTVSEIGLKVESDHKDTLRFWKASGTKDYIFYSSGLEGTGESNHSNNHHNKYYMTLGDADKQEEAIRKDIRNWLVAFANKTQVNDKSVTMVIKSLNNIMRGVGELDVKQKHANSKHIVLNNVRELITKLSSELG
jgi:hypothetical protein